MSNILGADDPQTVKSAWYLYDLEEQALWDIYSQNPDYLRGRQYIELEKIARDKCEKTVQMIRNHRSPRKEID